MPLRRLAPALLTVLAACLPEAPSGVAATPATETIPTPPGLVIGFPDAAPGDSAGLVALASAVFGTTDSVLTVRHYPHAGMVWVQGLTEAEQLRIAADPRVGITDTLAVATIAQAPAWALDRLDQRALPLDGAFSHGYGTGNGVRLYIFDTGLKPDHAQFGGRTALGFDAVSPALSSPGDCHGHGTLSASAAAGATLGTATSASLIDIRVLGCSGGGTAPDFLEGINWLIQQKQQNPSVPMVANMSLGFSGVWPAADDAVAALVAAGVHVVAAAGNSNVDACGVSPARAPAAITVGASTSGDARAGFSNFGPCVDVYAPGHQVLGADIASTTATRQWSGTSAAAPYVAGLVAAYVASRPTLSPAQVHADLVNGAATGVLTGASPNRLAWANFAENSVLPTDPRATLSVRCIVRRCVASVTRQRGQPAVLARDVEVTGTLRDTLVETATGATWRFAQPGTYRVTAVGTHDGTSRPSRSEREITIIDRAPTIRSASATCTGGVCRFTVAARDDEAVASIAWTLPDTTLTGASVTRTFTTGGARTATVTVRDSLDQAVSRTVNFIVANQPPTARLSARCSGRTCTLDASGSRDDSGIASYRYNSGASGAADVTSTSATTSVSYAFAGTYRASVVVTDRTGLTSRAEVSITVQ